MSALGPVCKSDPRREKVRNHPRLAGFDYVEVDGAAPKITAFLLGKVPDGLDPSNFLIEGGTRVRDVHVTAISITCYHSVLLDDSIELTCDRAGDLSQYTLRAVAHTADGETVPHPGFDPRYNQVEFTFAAGCPSDLDCATAKVCVEPAAAEPDINYLAKDYASFRRLILDRLAVTMPGWTERHVPDLGIALVELLAYAGDHLSYYQDAVATEAYLDTARLRTSVRRHARLVNYHMHEGANARAWVCITTNSDLILPAETYFITRGEIPVDGRPLLADEDLRGQSGFEVFEPLPPGEISVWTSHNRIRIYTWGGKECCLDKGVTTATLIGRLTQEAPGEPCTPGKSPVAAATAPTTVELHLRAGSVILFEEVIGPRTGSAADADPAHRQAVRLTRVGSTTDPLYPDLDLVEVEWGKEDALRFPLCLSVIGPPPECRFIEDVSVVCGNVVLADHGKTADEDLPSVPTRPEEPSCCAEGRPADVSPTPGAYRPTLAGVPLTFSQPFDANTAAVRALDQDPRRTVPQAALLQSPAGVSWTAVRDLLESGPFDKQFVVEIDNDGIAHLRFGDGRSGRRPEANSAFHARYRVGNGASGNVGAGAIAHLVTRKTRISASIFVRNPLPATGGSAPEPIADVKLLAPYFFRTHLERAVTADDYAALAVREFPGELQGAAAQLCWNGSWFEAVVAVDPLGREAPCPALLQGVAASLERYRRIGQDVRVIAARRVPLLIGLHVCLQPGFDPGPVHGALADLFSNRVVTGKPGLFHPDNLRFGEDVYLSQLVAAAQRVEGVACVEVVKLEREFEGPAGEIESGVLGLERFEIAQLENDGNFPEHGRLEFAGDLS